jgi:NAD-dependent DNA ligase
MINNFQDKHVVLTGDFAMGERNLIALEIEAQGGKVHSGVTKKVDAVIVGSYGSKAWKTPLAGNKIIKAQELGIEVIMERDIANLMPMTMQ